jgi:hypothetical protein
MPKILGLQDGGVEGSRGIVVKDKFWRQSIQFTETYVILADDLSQSEEVILSTSGLPSIGDVVGGAICVNKNARDIGTVIHPVTKVPTALWEVTIECNSELDTNAASEAQQDDATDFRQRERWTKEVIEEVRGYDALGNKVQTPTFEPIEFSIPRTVPVLEITRYERPPVDPMILLNYVNKVNKKTFRGAPKGCALMDSIEFEEEWIKNSLYIRATYVIKFKIELDANGDIRQNVEGWNPPILAESHFYYPPTVPLNKRSIKTRERFADKSGATIKMPITKEGYRNDGPPQYLDFKRYGYADFSNLNL